MLQQEVVEKDKMSNNNLTYTIINVSDITPSIMNDCIQTSVNTLAKSVDESQAILKWEGTPPSWVASLGLSTYTQTQIKEAIKIPEWIPSGPEG